MTSKMKNTAYWKKKFAESEKASPYNKSSFTTNGDPERKPEPMISSDDSGNVIPSTRHNAPRQGPYKNPIDERLQKEKNLPPRHFKPTESMIEAGHMYDDKGFIVDDPELKRKQHIEGERQRMREEAAEERPQHQRPLPTFEKGDVSISQYDEHGNKLYNIAE